MESSILFDVSFYSTLSAVVLLVWFRSDAFVEYLELLRLDAAFGVRKYRKASSEVSYQMRYTDFLLLRYNSFLVRLITCPLCFSVWISVIISATTNWFYFPFLVVLPLTIYNHLEEKL